MEMQITYYAGNASRDGQEPKETGCTSINSMSSSSKSGSKNDEQGCAHKGNLTAHSITHETNDELPDNITYVDLDLIVATFPLHSPIRIAFDTRVETTDVYSAG